MVLQEEEGCSNVTQSDKWGESSSEVSVLNKEIKLSCHTSRGQGVPGQLYITENSDILSSDSAVLANVSDKQQHYCSFGVVFVSI